MTDRSAPDARQRQSAVAPRVAAGTRAHRRGVAAWHSLEDLDARLEHVERIRGIGVAMIVL